MLDQIWVALSGGGLVGGIAGLVSGIAGAWIQNKKLQREFAAQNAAEAVARELLNLERWDKRSFKSIKNRIGGFEDNELRKILVAAGAVRFESKGEEFWGLASRNRNDL